MPKAGLRKEIQKAMNTNSAENTSNTPDFILALYLEAWLWLRRVNRIIE